MPSVPTPLSRRFPVAIPLSFARPFRAAHILTLALVFLLPVAGRADFASDVQEPLRLLQAKQFSKALVALQKMAPQHQDEFGLHYMMGLAHLGGVNDKMKAAESIKTLQLSHASLLKAQQLAQSDEQKKQTLELLTTAEAGLQELGVSVEKTTPQTETATNSKDAKDAEIEELKRRLAELETKPTPAKSTPPPVASPNRVVPSKYPAVVRRKGYVVGRILTSAGQPLVGADISITGTSGTGENAKFAAVSGAGGLFSQRVPDGIYRVVAEWKTRYNDYNYKFDLDPEDGKNTVIHQSAPGIVKNFRWKISGLRPGEQAGKPNTFGESTKYYGGHISVNVQRHSNIGNDFVYFPQGSTLVMTLVPRAKLIDGSTGTPLTYRHTLKSNITYYEYLSWYIDDIPVGLYTVSVQWVGADGKSRPVKVRLTKDTEGAFTPSVPLDFEPGQFDNLQSMSVSIDSPLLP